MSKSSIKPLLIALLAVGFAVGCATTPQQSEPTGPTEAELEAQRAQAAAERAARENEQYMNQARSLLDEVRGFSGLNADQQARLSAAEAAIANNEGRRAHDILSALVAELRAAKMTYSVMRGDSLWGISGKSEVYGDPYQWPLIYKANASQIRDADLIYPGQKFEIDKNPSSGARDAAINHARNRGAWSVGEEEASDKAYLSR
ncbi:MAG: LysM peptidoglycan-binding domain-containing protein [Gammaproteobacteria bacterium]|nr:LysM peptidoglycan-binding domain-containing protein [Gammaproteobacteria bacterium]